MKIGIFGGSFNPPHKMHEEIATSLIEQKVVDTIIFVPTGMKYEYKNNLIENEYRLDMLEIIASHNPSFQVSDYECQEEVVYTYQTLDHFKELYPNDEIFFICGSDNLSYIDKWKNAEYLMNHHKFIVVDRNTHVLEPLLEKYQDFRSHIVVANITPQDVSSSEIRERLKEGKPLQDFISEDVLDYIEANNLYKEE